MADDVMRRVGGVTLLLIVCLSVPAWAGRWRRQNSPQSCVTHPRLRDKWHVMGEGRRESIRVRTHQVVFRHKGKVVRYRCVEKTGNIYLLRRKNIYEKQDGVLCLAFSLLGDHPRGEYRALRLIGPGEDTGLMSPVIVPKKTKISIKNTCHIGGVDLDEDSEQETNAFIRRSLPGCKFPKQIQGRWNYTYQHARSFEIWKRNATIHLMSGKSIKFLCDKREGRLFVLRSDAYVSANEDAITCVEFLPTEQDEFYSFQVSRHNSGHLLDGQLKSMPAGKSVYIHVDCDWIGSPARPEFLYP